MRAPDPMGVCWVDGKRSKMNQASVALDDPAVLAGVGLFETISIEDGVALDLEPHLERLTRSGEQLGIPLPKAAALRATLSEALAGDAPARGWLKIVVTGGGRNFVFRGVRDPEMEGRPVTALLLPWRRNLKDPLVGLKTLNYASNRLGLERATSRGADEGLWLNTRGHLAEGCWSNLFVLRGRRLFTPGVREGILPGVVRGVVLRAAARAGFSIHEGRLRLPRLIHAREAFLTSSLRGVCPLVRFEGREIGTGRPGPSTERIGIQVAEMRRA